MEKLYLEKTKKGFPALWEEGGGYTNTGEATIIAGPEGNTLIPIYVKQKGHLACSQHALFVIKEGYFVIKIYRHRGEFNIKALRIESIDLENREAQAKVFWEGTFTEGFGWAENDEPPSFLYPAVKVAMEKADYYHCRRPLYFKTPFFLMGKLQKHQKCQNILEDIE